MSDTDLTAFIEARLDEAQRRAEAMEHDRDWDDDYRSCLVARIGTTADRGYSDADCTCDLAERKAEALRWVKAVRTLLEKINRAEAASTAVDNIEIDYFLAGDLRCVIAGIWPEQPPTAPQESPPTT